MKQTNKQTHPHDSAHDLDHCSQINEPAARKRRLLVVLSSLFLSERRMDRFLFSSK